MWSQSVDNHVAAIFIASDSPKYKSCRVFLDDDLEMNATLTVLFTINEGLISIYLLYLLYSKTMQTEQEKLENQGLSIHFSQRDTKNMIDTARMRRCLFVGITSLLIQWLSMVVTIPVGFNHAVSICHLLNAVSVFVSFDGFMDDVKSCFYNNSDTDINNENNRGNIELTESQREYMARIMKAYHATPSRHRNITSLVIPNHQH